MFIVKEFFVCYNENKLNKEEYNKQMAKLYFKYGTMSSGKSLDLITTAYNYEKQNKRILVYTSSIDTRSGFKKIESRTGHFWDANYIPSDANLLYKKVSEEITKHKIYCLLVDESQFLSKEQIIVLANIVDDFDIPVICWGLKNDFQNNLFEGSATLLAYADKIEYLKTICVLCNKKAVMNLRTNNGKAVYSGEQILVGDTDYVPVCRKCYNNYDILKRVTTN